MAKFSLETPKSANFSLKSFILSKFSLKTSKNSQFFTKNLHFSKFSAPLAPKMWSFRSLRDPIFVELGSPQKTLINIVVHLCAICTKYLPMLLIQISGNVQSVNVMVNTEYQLGYLEIILVKCKSSYKSFQMFSKSHFFRNVFNC